MRWIILQQSEDGQTVRLFDSRTSDMRTFAGTRALYDALGLLADWREAQAKKAKAVESE